MRCVAFIMIMLCRQWASAQQQRPPVAQSEKPDRYLLVTKAPPVILVTNADSSLIGGISMKGDTVIPLRYYSIYNPTLGAPVRDGLMFLMDTVRTPFPPGYFSGLSAVTRSGTVLYHPFLFDNGPDYWQEGRQRFGQGNRMGFVNRFGEVTVPAKYPFVFPYHNGDAWACFRGVQC